MIPNFNTDSVVSSVTHGPHDVAFSDPLMNIYRNTRTEHRGASIKSHDTCCLSSPTLR